MNIETSYLEALRNILAYGDKRETRNGATRSLFAIQLRHDMRHGFPALTTKKLAFKAVKSELLWFLAMGKGKKKRANDDDLKILNGTDKTIWTANADAPYWKMARQGPGDLGRIYGMQWRDWVAPYSNYAGDHEERVDQIAEAIKLIKTDPTSRRIIVTAWNPGELDDMALPPCHMMFQFYVEGENLSLHMVQRSADMFLGVPFNIASYGLLLAMVANATGKTPKELVLTLNDAHIYEDHVAAVEEQLTREPLPLSKLFLKASGADIDSYTMDDIMLAEYQSHPSIKAPMAV